MNSLNTSVLKATYLECFGTRASTGETLRETVKVLVDRGVSRRTLIAWAVETGCTKGYASKLLSQILCALGLRKRRTGAGRKPSAEVMKLLAYAQAEFGDKHLKVLRAAWRTGKAQSSGDYLGDRATVLIRPALERVENNYGSVIINPVVRREVAA